MSNYFNNSKNSELSELQIDLNSMNLDVKKEAAKQVIAMMTIGKDVSSLFPHMVKCMETNSIELKKLVYLYIINYAKSKADLAIMAVNSFQKDAKEKNSPLLRALSIRTMGCIRIEKITTEFLDSLRNGLQDYDPYVKKTAAIAVAKLFSISPKLVIEQELIKMLQGLLQDGNAIVVANACAALLEISNATGKSYFKFSKSQNLHKILNAVNESNEWGQIFILEAISTHDPKDSDEAEQICERILPRLSHNNPAVLLSSVKVVLKNVDFIKDAAMRQSILKKLPAPLITLISCEAELQYVALRNISFILQKQPSIFENNVKVFYCKFNDPVYVKLEKVEILIKVADKSNADQIIQELKEYSSDVDMELVGASVKAIGQIVLKVESSVRVAAQCIHDIVKHGQPLALQEAVVVAKDILRKFPNKYQSLIQDLVKKVDDFYEVEAKASIIWIVGEYAENIDTSEKIIEEYKGSFLEDPDAVKLALLTAAVKLYLKKPEKSEGLIQSLLKVATEEADNPDLRDRAYIYWRMLSNYPAQTADVVLGNKPNISSESYNTYNGRFVEELLSQISTICSIYHKTPEEMVKLYGISQSSGMVSRVTANKVELGEKMKKEQRTKKLESISEVEPAPKKAKAAAEKPKKQKLGKMDDDTSSEEEEAPKKKPDLLAQEEPPKQNDLLGDLLGMDSNPTPATTAPSTDLLGAGITTTQQPSGDLLGDMLGQPVPTNAQAQIADDFGGDPFGQGGQQENKADAGEDDWAGFGADAPSSTYNLSYASQSLKEVLNISTPGNKQKKTGLGVNASVNYSAEHNQIVMELEFSNQSGGPLSDFDLMINKNRFGICPDAPCSKHNITYPAPFETSPVQVLPLRIDKSKADPKAPLKEPFVIQIAMKSSLDVFYFNVPVVLHSLISRGGPSELAVPPALNDAEFNKFWDMITQEREFTHSVSGLSLGLNRGVSVLDDFTACLQANGFGVFSLASARPQQPGQSLAYFGAKTVNNLPLLFEVAHPFNGDNQSLNITYKVPVLPLKPMLKDALAAILASFKKAN